ncbi:hypothetical protein BV22DRAFT_1135235 [Leucogyrophana mollusca]|uniref:Uncharacterized protein n=1 Tax=Leucogyrophana mollusca TaxID=85980 RepID=A0ACB8AW95_9AGAM|nr:hypothetical protein BV22DRAFT_1135235 [Leucogyrophana mollusca]
MSIYVYELPTTGAIPLPTPASTSSWGALTPYTEATRACANLRGVLKLSKRTDCDDTDYPRLAEIHTPPLTSACCADPTCRSWTNTSRLYGLSFQPVPKHRDLQARAPVGCLAVAPKPSAPPRPAFGPGSAGWEVLSQGYGGTVGEGGRGTWIIWEMILGESI